MPLTHNQKANLATLTAVCFIVLFFSGIGWLVFWSTETSSVQHFCSDTVGITITHTNGDGDSTVVKFNDPKCR